MQISVFSSPAIGRKRQVESAIEILNSNQSDIYFNLNFADIVPSQATEASINPQRARRQIINALGPIENPVIITDCEFDNNWFSMTASQGTIISTGSWEQSFSPPALKTYLQMELILHSVACAADLTDDMMEKMSHDTSIGCLFDFCHHKSDVKFKIIGGHLCETCAGKLISYGLRSAFKPTFDHLLEIMRSDSIGRATSIKADTVFAAMRFTKNDANDHSFRYGIIPAFASVGLGVQRADSVAASGVLIEKIFRMIDEAWAVVVLSGENNLNVFFEYGYAIGRRKPIFLVTPSNKFSDTPTDLRGLEHIVYQEGDFGGLEAAITQRLKGLPRFA